MSGQGDIGRSKAELNIRDLKQHDAFNRTLWSVLSIDKLVTWQHLSVERTGRHVVMKALSCLNSLIFCTGAMNCLLDEVKSNKCFIIPKKSGQMN